MKAGIITASILALTVQLSCAPGKGGGGIGCSKTSSILKTPTLISTASESAFDPSKVPSSEEQRSLFYKHFGQFKSKTAGGYLYIQSRPKTDNMAAVASESPWNRCSALIEFPKRTGEIRSPEDSNSPWFSKSEDEIIADRFPGRNDPLKIRIYSAAHCFDYSINERVFLSLFNSTGQELSGFDKAYLNVEIYIPELEAVKTLRSRLESKITSNEITRQNARDVLSAFQPAVRDMHNVFGVSSDGTRPTNPTPKQGCMLPPEDSGDAKQYTCATYHDLIVLDIEAKNLSTTVDTALRDLRDRSVQQIRKLENDGPDLASPDNNPSPWKDYASNPGFRMFIGDALHSSCTQLTAPTTQIQDPNNMFPSPVTTPTPSQTDAACTGRVFPADPSQVQPGVAMSEYPKVYTITLSCSGLSASECDEVPINTLKNLQYVRYTTRERLRTFSRYNMVGSLPNLPTALLSCGGSTTGLCSAKDDVQTALNAVADNLSLSTSSLSSNNFLSESSRYGQARRKVDGALAIWKDFFDANSEVNLTETDTVFGNINVTSSKDLFKKQLNPVNFLDLHSNFTVQERSVPTFPDPKDSTLRRAFLKLPINNIIGLDEFSSFTLDSSASPRPIHIESWNADGQSGHFLRFWTTKNQMNSYLDNYPLLGTFNVNFNPADPNSFIVLLDKPTVDPLTDLIAKIPTQATLQKGDSGSVFTLDGIPMFALSTVNGEPTSGGAAVAAIPIAAPDTDDRPPGSPAAAEVPQAGSKNAVVTCK